MAATSLLQIVNGVFTSMIREGSMNTVRLASEGIHDPFGSIPASVSVTCSFAISPGPGVYIVLRSAGSSKLPSPSVVQSDSVADPPIDPEMLTVSPAQIVWSAPVDDEGAAIKVRVTEFGLTVTGQPDSLTIDTIVTVALIPTASSGTFKIPVTGSNDGKNPSRQTRMDWPLVTGKSLIWNGGKYSHVEIIDKGKYK